MFAKIVRGLVGPTVRRPRRSIRPVLEALDVRVVPVVDQVFDPGQYGSPYLSAGVAYYNTNQEIGQTFTVGVSGTLTQVDLYIYKWEGTVGDLVLDIRGTRPDGRPTAVAGQQLITTSVPPTSVPGLPGNYAAFFTFDLTPYNVYVAQGEVLAAILHVAPAAGADAGYQWDGRTVNAYPNGLFYGRVIGNHDWTASDPSWDLGFRTYVEPATPLPPVVTLPGGPASYVENDPGVVLSPTATVADPDTSMLDGGTLTVSLTANGTATDRLEVRNDGSAAGQIGVANGWVTYGGTAFGTIAGGTGTTPLVISLNPSASRAAVEALVRNITFRTLADAPVTNPRTVQVVVTDGDGSTSDPVTTTVTVTPTNDVPAVTTNTTLTVAEGATGTITAARLTTTDPDNNPAQLTYTVTTPPTRGTLRLGGNPTSTFTQADITAGQVTYQHDGSETAPDSFAFTVSDGAATSAVTTFNITVTQVNDPPVVTTNTGLTVAQGAAVAITSARLAATDPDNTPTQVRFTVTAAPAHGLVRRSGVPVSTFTQADINAGLVSYQHSGSGMAPDGFTFTVNDGSLTTAPATVSITVLPPEPVVTISGYDPTAGTVTFTGDGSTNLNDRLELFAVDVGGGQYALGHNLTTPGLVGNTDLNPGAPGVQQLILGSGTAPLITVDLKAGDDSLGIDNTGGHFTTPVSYDGGTGRDRLRLDGTLPNIWTLTGANAGTVTGTAVGFTGAEDLTGSTGDDAFVFGAGAAIGRLDGGAGANALDYRGLATPVEVFLSAGWASQTSGVTGIRTAFGGSAADLLAGTADADVLVGGGGDDTAFGGGGDDVLTGGAGNDLLVGGAGIDRVSESFPNVLTVTLLNTSLNGGTDTGVDLLDGVEGASLTGGPGNNVFRASKFTLGSVTLAGGAGNDKLYGGTQGDLLVGGDGKDNLIGGAGNDTFTGGKGNDVLNGGAGDDQVRETDILGTNVTLSSGRLKTDATVLGTDVLMSINRAFLSLAATETVGRTLSASGFRTGPVTLVGGAGADTLIGTVRAGDLLQGGAGADTLNSGKGADTVDGGPDADVHVTVGGAALDDTVLDL